MLTGLCHCGDLWYQIGIVLGQATLHAASVVTGRLTLTSLALLLCAGLYRCYIRQCQLRKIITLGGHDD